MSAYDWRVLRTDVLWVCALIACGLLAGAGAAVGVRAVRYWHPVPKSAPAAVKPVNRVWT